MVRNIAGVVVGYISIFVAVFPSHPPGPCGHGRRVRVDLLAWD